MIYERIKDCCIKKGISISKLEQDLNISRGSLCKIDKHKPSMRKIMMIADYLDIDAQILFDEIDNPDEYIMYRKNLDGSQTATIINKQASTNLLNDILDRVPKYDYRSLSLLEMFGDMQEEDKQIVISICQRLVKNVTTGN